MALSATVPTQRERFGWGLNALGAIVAGVLVRSLPSSLLLDGAPLWAVCWLLALACIAAALTPLGATRWADITAHFTASVRLATVLFLSLTWTGAGRELWAAMAVYIALADGEKLASRRPIVPTAIALAAVTAWTATDTRVAPGRAVLIGLVCAAAAAWGAEHPSASAINDRAPDPRLQPSH